MSGCKAEGLFVGSLDFQADRLVGLSRHVILDKCS